jgi:hypothetical protein
MQGIIAQIQSGYVYHAHVKLKKTTLKNTLSQQGFK